MLYILSFIISILFCIVSTAVFAILIFLVSVAKSSVAKSLFLHEVAVLSRLGLEPSLPAMKALGLRALARYLKGDLSLDDARQLACKATRNYAKRQCTWFRNQLTADIKVEDPVVYKGEVIAAVSRFLLTASCQRTSVSPFPAASGVGKS